MSINFIDYAELCDRAFASMLNNANTYIKTECGVFVPPPSKEIKQLFSYSIGVFAKEKFSQYDRNLLVRSCRPNDNWRLKHVGKRYSNMIESKLMLPVNGKINIDISSGWDDFFDDFFKKSSFKKFEVPEVDTYDIIKVISISETVINILYKNQMCLIDGNCMIDHSLEIPKYIMNSISRVFTESGALK